MPDDAEPWPISLFRADARGDDIERVIVVEGELDASGTDWFVAGDGAVLERHPTSITIDARKAIGGRRLGVYLNVRRETVPRDRLTGGPSSAWPTPTGCGHSPWHRRRGVLRQNRRVLRPSTDRRSCRNPAVVRCGPNASMPLWANSTASCARLPTSRHESAVALGDVPDGARCFSSASRSAIITGRR
jgi:hypothetical protein